MSELYALPEGWEWKELRSFGKFIRGVTYKKDQLLETHTNNSLTLLRANNIQSELNLDEVQIIPEPVAKGKTIQDGDILFAMSSGSKHIVGKNILLSGLKNYTFGAFCSVYRNESHDVLDNYYLSYVLKSNLYRKKLSELSMGANINNLKAKDLEVMKIPLPPLQEQKRIVAKLDSLFAKIDHAIALHQQNIDEAEALMGSVLDEVFGELEEKYEKKALGNLTTTTSGGTPKRSEKSYWGGNIGWLKSGELNNGYITEVQEFITEKGLQKSSAKLFPKGTLLIAMYGATVGKLGILDIETTTNQAICAILNDKGLFETKYMFYFFQKSKEKMLLDSTGGAQPNISQTYLKQLQVIYPPLKTQQKTVQYLDRLSQKTEQLKQVQQEKMQHLKALKASILDRAFRGVL